MVYAAKSPVTARWLGTAAVRDCDGQEAGPDTWLKRGEGA